MLKSRKMKPKLAWNYTMSALLFIGCSTIVSAFTRSSTVGAPPESAFGRMMILLIVVVLVVVPIDYFSYRRRLRSFREAESLSGKLNRSLPRSKVPKRLPR